MKQSIEKFSHQLSEAIKIGQNARLNQHENKFRNVIICGMGGSGIGGTMVSELVENEARIPVCVNKNYTIPAYVNNNTLAVFSSYSGNTEETLTAFDTAIKKGAKIVVVSSGGKLVELAIKNKIDYIVIPGGMQPRACLGYSLVQIFYILKFYSIIDKGFEAQFRNAITLLDAEEGNIAEEALGIATRIDDKIPVIYSVAGFEGAAVRFRQQINENSKSLGWQNVIPEMNHNEVVGWSKNNEKLAVIIFRNSTDHERNQKRADICKSLFEKHTSTVIEVWSKGNSAIERAMYIVHLGDWISYFLAKHKDVDVDEVKVIDRFKTALAGS